MQTFEFNLSLILGHTIIYEYNLDKVVECRCDFGSDPTSSGESMDSILQAYRAHLPALMQATTKQIEPTEQAKLAAAQATDPGYLALQTALFKQYGPELAKAGADINAQNALAQANSDLAVVTGPGRQLTQAALDTQKIADPEYYATRKIVSDKLNQLLGTYDPTGLSEAERANVERASNQDQLRRGTYNTPSAIAAIENAMQYGDELNKKRTTLAQILGISSGAIPNLKSNVDAYQVATGKPSTGNLGDTKFMGANKNIGGETFSMGNSLLNTATQMQQQANDEKFNRRTTFDDVAQGFGVFSNLLGSVGSFRNS